MPKLKDLSGMKFGRLTVLGRGENHKRPSGATIVYWICQCSCEEKTIISVDGSSLRNNRTKSCGCLMRETSSLIGKSCRQTNRYNLDGEYGVGYTSSGDEFWFDLEDYDLIKNYCWYYNSNGYVITTVDRKVICLHRMVMGFPDIKYDVDHKNHPPRAEKKIDNRKTNLEVVTHSENLMNSSLRVDNQTGFKGVYWREDKQKWQVKIHIDKKQKHFGYYDTKDEAIKAREEAEILYYGEHRYNANN